VVEDVRRALMEGRCPVPGVGSVAAGRAADLPFVVMDADEREVEPVSAYLRDLALGDASRLTCRSYAFDLLRWHRLLWMLTTPWEKATEAEVAVLVGWLRQAPNPQRRRRSPDSSPPGSVNLKTGKPALRVGYAPRTINHALTVIYGYYSFHSRFGDGPVLNPVPVSAERRRALAHRSPLEPAPVVRRARLRQKVPVQAPRAIPDQRWDEFFAEMGCDRDRGLLEFYVSSGARAGELLGIGLEGHRLARPAGLRDQQGNPGAAARAGLSGRFPLPRPLPGHRRASRAGPAGLAHPARAAEAIDVLGDAPHPAAGQRQAGHELDFA
jgi:hypothetical protein